MEVLARPTCLGQSAPDTTHLTIIMSEASVACVDQRT
jgi:hypothetical protein